MNANTYTDRPISCNECHERRLRLNLSSTSRIAVMGILTLVFSVGRHRSNTLVGLGALRSSAVMVGPS